MSVLVVPDLSRLPAFADALARGWLPSNVDGERIARSHLARIETDPTGFVASLDDREALGAPITLPDGTTRPRLPGFYRWIWDGAFCGQINLRWQKGTAELPSHVLGHIGYTVVAWKRRQGLATAALRDLLPEIRVIGLPYVDLTTDADNVASRKVIESANGICLGAFQMDPALGGTQSLRYRIIL